jgi:Mg2+/Co2+ transporter CorB
LDTVSFWVPLSVLAILLGYSAFFAMAETALMAANKHRLRHLAKRGNRRADNTLWLLERSDSLLSLVLIANTLINAMATALVSALAIASFGYEKEVIALSTAMVAFLLIMLAEISPKMIGAAYPEKIALCTGIVLKPLISVARPVTWFVNLFVSAVLMLLRVKRGGNTRARRRCRRKSCARSSSKVAISSPNNTRVSCSICSIWKRFRSKTSSRRAPRSKQSTWRCRSTTSCAS